MINYQSLDNTLKQLLQLFLALMWEVQLLKTIVRMRVDL
jgi:hypothetical protein